MTRDRVYFEELAHDSQGANPEPFMKQALDSLVDDLLTAGKARGLSWGLQDFLNDMEDLPELVSAAITKQGYLGALSGEIERRLRRELEDHDAVHDLAAELAAGDDE